MVNRFTAETVVAPSEIPMKYTPGTWICPSTYQVLVPQVPPDMSVEEESNLTGGEVPSGPREKIEYWRVVPAGRFVVPAMVNGFAAYWSLNGFIWIHGEVFVTGGHGGGVGVSDGTGRIRISCETPQSDMTR
jgi:hypothetical protein